MEISTNLRGKEGVEKLKALVEEIKICLFGTNLKADDGSTCRPMTAQEVDYEGNIWFFSAIDSDVNREIEQYKHVQLFFSNPDKNIYLTLNGDAEVVINPYKVDELWSPLVKVWFKEGKEDPSLSLIKVHTNKAHYWDADGNKMVNFFKLLASAVTGKNLIDSSYGTVKV